MSEENNLFWRSLFTTGKQEVESNVFWHFLFTFFLWLCLSVGWGYSLVKKQTKKVLDQCGTVNNHSVCHFFGMLNARAEFYYIFFPPTK